jgi:hypothetical protein
MYDVAGKGEINGRGMTRERQGRRGMLRVGGEGRRGVEKGVRGGEGGGGIGSCFSQEL